MKLCKNGCNEPIHQNRTLCKKCDAERQREYRRKRREERDAKKPTHRNPGELTTIERLLA